MGRSDETRLNSIQPITVSYPSSTGGVTKGKVTTRLQPPHRTAGTSLSNRFSNTANRRRESERGNKRDFESGCLVSKTVVHSSRHVQRTTKRVLTHWISETPFQRSFYKQNQKGRILIGYPSIRPFSLSYFNRLLRSREVGLISNEKERNLFITDIINLAGRQ